VGGLDPGDHADRATGVVVREQQVVGRLGQEPLGGRRERRCVEQIDRPVYGVRVLDPLDAHGDTLGDARVAVAGSRQRPTMIVNSGRRQAQASAVGRQRAGRSDGGQ
jgi:hypothetical protein